MALRYFVIKTGVCCDGVAPDWVIDNVSLEWKEAAGDPPVAEITNNIFKNGTFASGKDNWAPEALSGAAATFSYENEEFFADIEATTDQHWHISLWQKPIALVEGKTYVMSFDARYETIMKNIR